MEIRERERLKVSYAEMPDEQIMEMILQGKDEFQPEAYDLLKQEAWKRGLEEKIEDILQGNNLPYAFYNLNLSGNNFPSELTVEKSKIEAAIKLFSKFTPKNGGLILW